MHADRDVHFFFFLLGREISAASRITLLLLKVLSLDSTSRSPVLLTGQQLLRLCLVWDKAGLVGPEMGTSPRARHEGTRRTSPGMDF